MLARVVTLRFDPVLEAFDDEPLQEFLKAKEVFCDPRPFFRSERGALLGGACHLRPATACASVLAPREG